MPIINDIEFDHGDCELKVDGIAYEFEEINYTCTREMEEGHGNAREPRYQTMGRSTTKGDLTVREHVWYMLRDDVLRKVYGGEFRARPSITVSKGKGDDNHVDSLVKTMINEIGKGSKAGVAAGMVKLSLQPIKYLEDGLSPWGAGEQDQVLTAM